MGLHQLHQRRSKQNDGWFTFAAGVFGLAEHDRMTFGATSLMAVIVRYVISRCSSVADKFALMMLYNVLGVFANST
jgi:hypothetical protein